MSPAGPSRGLEDTGHGLNVRSMCARHQIFIPGTHPRRGQWSKTVRRQSESGRDPMGYLRTTNSFLCIVLGVVCIGRMQLPLQSASCSSSGRSPAASSAASSWSSSCDTQARVTKHSACSTVSPRRSKGYGAPCSRPLRCERGPIAFCPISD